MKIKRKTVAVHSKRWTNRMKVLPMQIVTKQLKKQKKPKAKTVQDTNQLTNEATQDKKQVIDFEFLDVATLLAEINTDLTKSNTEYPTINTDLTNLTNETKSNTDLTIVTKLTLKSYNSPKINYYNTLAQTVFAETNIKEDNDGQTYTFLSADYVVNNTLLNNFKEAKAKLAQQDKSTKEIWAYHGTNSSNLDSIVQNGFYLPSSTGYSQSNGNAWGAGVYVGSTVQQSAGYSNYLDGPRDSRTNRLKVILCRVLVGKMDSHLGNGTIASRDALNNCDSYLCCQGKFYVSFKSAHVLPVFIVDVQYDNRQHY